METLKRYKLIKEYTNSPKINTIIEECYSVRNQFVNNNSSKRECYFEPLSPQFWQRVKNKKVKIYH